MAIDLYMMEMSPPCRAVVLTARYLGVEINKKYVDLLKLEQLKPEFLKMNPLHTVPTIDDEGLYVWESRAIMQYLVNQYAPDSDLYPKDPKKRAIIDQMLYFDFGTVYKSISDSLIGMMIADEEWTQEKESVIKKAMQTFEEFLGKTLYVAGDNLTIVDLSLITQFENLKVFAEMLIKFDLSIYPHIEEWAKRVEGQLPYYKEITEPGLLELKAFIEMIKTDPEWKNDLKSKLNSE